MDKTEVTTLVNDLLDAVGDLAESIVDAANAEDEDCCGDGECCRADVYIEPEGVTLGDAEAQALRTLKIIASRGAEANALAAAQAILAVQYR